MKYSIEKLTRYLNQMIIMKERYSIDKIEKQTNCFVLHKIYPIFTKLYTKLPKRITSTDTTILLGKLREEEKFYRNKITERKKGQKIMTEFLNG